MSLTTIISDDEVLARQKLRQLLADESDISIVGEGATALETIDLVQFTNPDLLFLDIQMPGMDAFDILSALAASTEAAKMPRIIFTTAFDQYAVRAFEINAVDYLLKPYTRQRLKEAVQRARMQIASPHENGAPVAAQSRAERANAQHRAGDVDAKDEIPVVEIEIFQFAEHAARTVLTDRAAWYVAPA